jgi:hypothetical protein
MAQRVETLSRICPGLTATLALTFGLTLGACGSAGPYGFARNYTPLSAESDAADDAVDYDPVAYERRVPGDSAKRVSVFGVVRGVSKTPDGSTEALIGIRALQGRNLCETDESESCRVTVSEAEFGAVYVRMTLRPENANGPDKLDRGVLIRAIGNVAQASQAKTGANVILANYYRVWPVHKYVTTEARSYMLR